MLKHKEVIMLGGVHYKMIDNKGLYISQEQKSQILDVDHIVLCSGQSSVRNLEQILKDSIVNMHIIGGADVAAEVDAKRATKQGIELAITI